MEILSYLLPVFVPLYYNLPIEYYIGYSLFTFSNYAFKNERTPNRLYHAFQYECFIFLYSLYIFHSFTPSYLMVVASLFDYQSTEGILFRTFIFLFTFFLNFYKNPLLFYPFIYIMVSSPFFITGNRSLFQKSYIIKYNIIQTLFFFLCYHLCLIIFLS